MPALPVLCREVLAETLRDAVVPRTAMQADVLATFQFDGFFTVAALRALMMLFFLLTIITMALWKAAETTDPDPEPEDSQSQKPQRHLAVDKLLSGGDACDSRPELAQLPGLPVPDLPQLCPPYMRAAQGARLTVAVPILHIDEGGSDVLGLGSSLVRGLPACLLKANCRGSQGRCQVLELREQEPGHSDSAVAGRVLLTVTRDLQLWRGEGQKGDCLGKLQPTPLGGNASRMRFLLQRPKDSLVVSLGAGRMELGFLSTGRLIAFAAHSGQDGDPLSMTVKPGVDAVFALGCLLSILTFADGAGALASQLNQLKNME
mmetsp:Transcript_47836/g.89543  ORF Transcript_47836/g.89543 Transcript_47836/m.89543 type:complete len:318 (+) Transcript_47836:162-1115(+)